MRKLVACCVLLGAIGISACNDDGTGPDDDIAGTYALVSINDEPLPFTLVAIGEDHFDLIAGSFTLKTDGTFTSSITERRTDDGNVTTAVQTNAGSYTTGVYGALTLTFESGTARPATIADGRLSFTAGDLTFTFEK